MKNLHFNCMQEQVYSRLGTLAAMALVHGGGAFQLFCNGVYEYVCGVEAFKLTTSIEEVPDKAVRDILLKVSYFIFYVVDAWLYTCYHLFPKIHNATNESHMKEVASENIDLLLECGFTKPVSLLNLEDKPELIHAVTLHKVVLCSLAKFEQFCNGMASLGVAESLKQNHHLYTPFYCIGAGDMLTSGTCMTSFFVLVFSMT